MRRRVRTLTQEQFDNYGGLKAIAVRPRAAAMFRTKADAEKKIVELSKYLVDAKVKSLQLPIIDGNKSLYRFYFIEDNRGHVSNLLAFPERYTHYK